MKGHKGEPRQRLRKQPRMRRVYSASAVPAPELSMPKTARKRKRRNSQQMIRRPISGARTLLLNSRWVSLAIAAACAYALFFIGGDDRFYLNYIPVEGVTSIRIDDIVAESGLAGHHIFAADPQAAAENISTMGGVVTATVTLHWPNEVMIRVREKPPVATWQEGDKTFWIDEDGQLSPARADTIGLMTIISEVPASTELALATATEDAQVQQSQDEDDESVANEAAGEGVATKDDEEGSPLSLAAFVPKDVLEGALQLRELRPNIDRLFYQPSSGLGYQDGRGWRAYFGTGLDMHQKLVVYETIVVDLLERGIQPEYISVANQHKPYYRQVP